MKMKHYPTVVFLSHWLELKKIQSGLFTLNILLFLPFGSNQLGFLCVIQDPQIGLSAPYHNLLTTLIKGLCPKGQVKKALHFHDKNLYVSDLIDDMHDCANVITYRSLIDSLCKSSQLDKAIALFNKMKDNGIQPDMYTLNILLHGLCKGKRLKNAQGLFQDLLDKGYHLNVYIYTVMINGLCKEGLIDEAFALWSNMEDSELHL
ncbi:Pentatricopeptide repeat-containing protein [Glycine soja]|uniref:Pentatricopeptide repeat-containing protein n=1 Tax=Glycine soja TaxID=3848 RepID=A0A445JUX0_GLYSO|nr:Pentatricopeptide repeat-containing protein [Glycine soja]